MLASKNMRPAITSPETGLSWLRVLCVELVGRLKEARGSDEVRVDIWPKTLVLSWRNGKFKRIIRHLFHCSLHLPLLLAD